MRRQGTASVRRPGSVTIAALVGIWIAPMAGSLAQTEAPGAGSAIGLGNRGWSASGTGLANVCERARIQRPRRGCVRLSLSRDHAVRS